ncbi:MAG: beta galactosidase jelly roll domain-containing protein, partial [Thermoanaerobaculales bacterium]|nr:beta galactosidase jelly roll domain-containing protein [Thermoanaerobaculales bacterium]
RADAMGRWRAEIPPMPAGGPYELTIASDGQDLSVGNVLVGDVWICSGQSNMEWTVADSMNAAREIEAAHDPEIRHFKVPRSWAEEPEASLAGGSWEAADPSHVGAFTAVGYFFARELRRHHDVPIGLINTSWGGSRIEPWMSAGSLGLDTDSMAEVLAAEKVDELGTLRAIRARIGDLPDTDHGLVDGRALWADPGLDDSSWQKMGTTSVWEEQGWEGMDGVAWYRTTFNLTAEEAETEIHLALGTIDDSDTTWVNGHEVGRTMLAWNKPRVYAVHPATLKEGRNVIAVRVEDTGGGGGLYGDSDQRYVEIAGTKRPLAGPWRFQVGLVTINTDYRKNQVPTVLYNKMVHPLLPYPVAGFLWYQGESNAGHDDALAYRTLFTTMIQEWRAGWGLGELPFLWAQLANYMAAADRPGDSDWAVLRESQSAALTLPKTAQAAIIDIGDADDIHPRNKQEVGRRLALAARGVAYGEEIVFSGPVYRSHVVQDGRVIIDFDHAGGGLVARGNAKGKLAEFAIAGADRHFVWAEAIVENNRVVVWSDEVQEPTAVRYAWADNPDSANLYNLEGLPASPFRTDSW